MEKKDLELLNVLGSGSFGKVYSCKYRPTKGNYAAKVFSLNSTSIQKSFDIELRVLSKVNHKNVV